MRELEFEVDDHVSLKVSSSKGVAGFGKGRLNQDSLDHSKYLRRWERWFMV